VNVEAPVAAAANVDGLTAKITAFLTTAKSAAADGLTWAEFGDVMLSLLRLVVSSLDTVSAMTGSQKKAFALSAVESLFDAVADKAVPLPLWPVWLLVRPAARSLVVALASGALEQVLTLTRKAAA
jgi:hypothetical protein